jgi:hypothetical protein
MEKAAQHSKGNCAQWFRYLRKYIDKCGTLFSIEAVKNLYNNEKLSPFQRVSLNAAFQEGSPTRNYIIGLNKKADRNLLLLLREKYGHNPSEQ